MFQKKGFTLVELAIVMTIIGLLIGGILKGQELLENARVTSTIAQVKSYDAAITGFRDIYEYLPGDLPDAGEKIAGCNENCTPLLIPGDAGAGDGMVSNPNGGSNCMDGFASGTSIPADEALDESWLMWVHLLKANLITGVTDIGIHESTDRRFGTTDPAAKIGGGFLPGSHLCVGSGSEWGYVPGLNLALITDDWRNIADLSDVSTLGGPGRSVMTPSRAAQLDRKMDDGRPENGTIRAIGDRAGYCNTADNEYAEQVSTKDCSLIIGLQQ